MFEKVPLMTYILKNATTLSLNLSMNFLNPQITF